LQVSCDTSHFVHLNCEIGREVFRPARASCRPIWWCLRSLVSIAVTPSTGLRFRSSRHRSTVTYDDGIAR